MKHPIKARLTIDEYANGIRQRDRVVLGQAITLIESSLPEDHQLASALIEKIIDETGQSLRIGITGVPGVGKSTFIETFGDYITSLGKNVAVLTIDPSSQLTKGSILGDKTRMETLSKNPSVFIRPSAAGNTLGGIANKTRETMLLCEAAGYDVIIIETVGVGQSEISVKGMVDFFLLLMLAGAGDELQGIKKGIVEMADALVITKADGDNLVHVGKAQAEYQHALSMSSSIVPGWNPRVLVSSALTGLGIEESWKTILEFKNNTQHSGHFYSNRKRQDLAWLQEYFTMLLNSDYQQFSKLNIDVKNIEEQVTEKHLSVHAAAQRLLDRYHQAIKDKS